MINKFIKIQNVGKFSNFDYTGTIHGDINFKKVNIIYGGNSTGKTTLTSIIRSLTKNTPNLISCRKTFGTDGEPHIKILCGTVLKEFKNNGWNENLDGVEIFDVFFTNENVYTGLEIIPEHKKGLYQFVIGKEGVSLSNEINELKNEIEEGNKNLKGLKENINLITDDLFQIEEFVSLEIDEHINEKIDSEKQEIETAKARQEIRTKSLFNRVLPLELPINLETPKELLQKSIKNISAEFLERVEHHKQKLSLVLGKEAEQWLKKGLSCIQDGKCPFCQRDLTEVKALITSYEQYFNEEYNKLKQSVDEYLKRIENYSINKLLSQRKETVLGNEVFIEFWKKYLPSLETPKTNLEGLVEGIITEFDKIKHLLKDKSQNILDPVDTKAIDRFINLHRGFNREIEAYNSQIDNWNDKINELKKKQLDLNKLKQELKVLEIQQKRFSPNVAKICGTYKTILDNVESKKGLQQEKQKKLKLSVSKKLENYGEKINMYLEIFGTTLRLEDPKTTYKGKSKEPYIDYTLLMDGYEIDLEEQAKYSLSEGDKNSLAFAFFLAKLSLDAQISDKIVVFDDPVSSLDRTRRKRSVEYICDLATKAKQVIVLSHNDNFIFELYEKLIKFGIEENTLKIDNGDIKEWDVKEEMKSPYFATIVKLESFMEGKRTLSLKEARELIRIVLEDALEFRYFKYFEIHGDNYWLKTMITTLRKEKSCRFRHPNREEVLQELDRLCDFSAPSHHGNINHPYREEEDEGEIKSYVDSTLKMIYEVI
ncbi:MAG: AAA family ATPase [Halobacteriota archaeon]